MFCMGFSKDDGTRGMGPACQCSQITGCQDWPLYNRSYDSSIIHRLSAQVTGTDIDK